MRIMKIYSLLVSFSVLLLANPHYIFVVDGSGSMGGKPIQEAKDAMMKTAKPLLLNDGVISVIVGGDTCQSQSRYKSKFVDNLKDLNHILKSFVDMSSGDNITLGFKEAQNEMIQHGYDGHIYLFGDCDGLEHCDSIESQAKKLAQRNKLIPFTYLFVDGCTDEEKNNWNKMVSTIDGAKAGAAASFDYSKIIQKKRQKIEMNKEYFTKPEFVNDDGSQNKGDNYKNMPWRCIKSDGLLWLAITKKEQSLNFFMKEPQTNTFYKQVKDNILISDYVAILNNKNTCGRNDWRLSDIFELSRLTQLGPNRRSRLFPYIKIWPHMSVTAAKFTGFRKGIDLNNGETYAYREDRPYAAMFVSGDIDKTLFEPPIEFLSRHKVTNKTIMKPKLTTAKDDIIDDIVFHEIDNVDMNKWIESNIVTISGINTSVPVDIDNGEIRINGGKWENTQSVLKNGDTLQVRHKSAKSENTVHQSLVTIGIKSISFVTKTKHHTIKKRRPVLDIQQAIGL